MAEPLVGYLRITVLSFSPFSLCKRQKSTPPVHVFHQPMEVPSSGEAEVQSVQPPICQCDSLPEDILTIIRTFLSLHNVLIMRLVCSTWAGNPAAWSRVVCWCYTTMTWLRPGEFHSKCKASVSQTIKDRRCRSLG